MPNNTESYLGPMAGFCQQWLLLLLLLPPALHFHIMITKIVIDITVAAAALGPAPPAYVH